MRMYWDRQWDWHGHGRMGVGRVLGLTVGVSMQLGTSHLRKDVRLQTRVDRPGAPCTRGEQRGRARRCSGVERRKQERRRRSGV